jgi:hypothetical protein
MLCVQRDIGNAWESKGCNARRGVGTFREPINSVTRWIRKLLTATMDIYFSACAEYPRIITRHCERRASNFLIISWITNGPFISVYHVAHYANNRSHADLTRLRAAGHMASDYLTKTFKLIPSKCWIAPFGGLPFAMFRRGVVKSSNGTSIEDDSG